MVAPFTGTVTIGALRTAFDDSTTTLQQAAQLGKKDYEYAIGPISTLTSSTDLSLRSIAFTPFDDGQVQVLAAHGTADAGSRIITVSLTVDNGDTTWLVDIARTKSATSSGASNTDARIDYRTTSGNVFRVLRGVRYRLAVSCDTAGSFSNVVAAIQIRSNRRRA